MLKGQIAYIQNTSGMKVAEVFRRFVKTGTVESIPSEEKGILHVIEVKDSYGSIDWKKVLEFEYMHGNIRLQYDETALNGQKLSIDSVIQEKLNQEFFENKSLNQLNESVLLDLGKEIYVNLENVDSVRLSVLDLRGKKLDSYQVFDELVDLHTNIYRKNLSFEDFVYISKLRNKIGDNSYQFGLFRFDSDVRGTILIEKAFRKNYPSKWDLTKHSGHYFVIEVIDGIYVHIEIKK